MPALDRALGGLYWGDNVVLVAPRRGLAEPFYRAVAATPSFDQRFYVDLSGHGAAPAGCEVVDARAGGPAAEPGPLLRGILERCAAADRNLLLFEDLREMIARWGAEGTARFFVRACPRLLELGAVAYWSAPAGDRYASLTEAVESVTQCVLVLEEGRLRIAKAEGRSPHIDGTMFRVAGADVPELVPAPAAVRVGAALRALRSRRRMSQSDVADLAGVTPSAISQAERGLRGLSLGTLLALTAQLDMTVDELLRGETVAGYRLGRRRHPRRRQSAGGDPLPLLDDPAAGLRAYLVHLPPREGGAPPVAHKGVELILVAHGLVQVVTGDGRPVLRGGEALLVDATTISRWQNLGASEATLFWVLRDSPERR